MLRLFVRVDVGPNTRVGVWLVVEETSEPGSVRWTKNGLGDRGTWRRLSEL